MPAREGEPDDRRDRLELLAELAGRLGAGRVHAEAMALAERVAEGRFFVACVGQFKRGKSTLLNALVGRPVLPTGVVPVTATPTILRWGDPPSALVRLSSGESRAIALDEVREYVAEATNPENVKGVAAVEILLPSPLLHGGMCLVDTPGLGSVFGVATEATHAFVPHIDAALLVVGGDPPISADEAALAARVAEQVPDVIVVLAKADRLTPAEREEARGFAEQVLERRTGRRLGPVLEVSSVERLAAGPTRDWDRLVGRLHELSSNSGRTLVQSARERAVLRIGDLLRTMVVERRRLLTAPVEERERQLDLLHRSGAALEQRLFYLGNMFAAEQGRLGDAFERRRNAFLARALRPALDALDEALAQGPRRGPAFRRHAAESARAIGKRLVEPWLEEEEAAADAMFGEAAARLVDAANRQLDELAASGDAGVRALPHALGPETSLGGRRRFYFNPFPTHFVSPVPLQWLFDSLAPPRWFQRHIRGNAEEFLRWLLEANSTRVRSDLVERAAETRRGLEHEIRSILEEARAWTTETIERARALQAEGARAVRPELERLDEVEAALADIV